MMEVLIVIAKKLDSVLGINLQNEQLQFVEESSSNLYKKNEHSYSSNEIHNHKQQNQIREALMKGYVEMSHINLAISKECEHVEYEAQHTVERLVSGG
jgi:CopG family transcriptional regulator / antitoxin EndoAI